MSHERLLRAQVSVVVEGDDDRLSETQRRRGEHGPALDVNDVGGVAVNESCERFTEARVGPGRVERWRTCLVDAGESGEAELDSLDAEARLVNG